MLSALAQRSKAHWDYDQEFLDRIRDSMRLTPSQIEQDDVWMLESDGVPLGYHRLVIGEPAELEDLWVDPPHIGSGVGRRLFEHATSVARAAGASAIELDADPNAVGFYERMGAVTVGATASTIIPGRSLPRLRLELSGAESARARIGR